MRVKIRNSTKKIAWVQGSPSSKLCLWLGFFMREILASRLFAVSVYTLDEQFYQTNQTLLRFRIENNSDDTLKGVELRYRVVQDSSDIAEPELYYLPNGIASWTFEDSVSATLVVYFPDVVLYPGDTLGGTSGFAVGLHRKDWNTWTKADDPSQPKSNHFSLAENVEVLSLALQRDSAGNFMDARYTANWKFYRSWENENVYSSFLNTAVLGYDDFSITSRRVVNSGELLYSGIFGLASGHVDSTWCQVELRQMRKL